MVLRTMQMSPESIILTWHFEGDAAEERSQRRI